MRTPIPLSGWADSELRALAALSGAAMPSGGQLLGERAALNGFRVPGLVSTGGGCRLFATRDGHVALNLSRADDRELLPALFGDAVTDLDARFLAVESAAIVARGRELGLAIASIDETPASPACTVRTQGTTAAPRERPLVIDLSALWAGPLATSLLRNAGAEVVKIESRTRPDTMRNGDPALFARLNQGKASLALDLRGAADREALIGLIRRAQFVVESARPRALRQLGVDADALVREVPGLVWVSITGHGITGDAADWVGFGDDCAVAGGLSAALRDATGTIGFVGDACADPLTGIRAARAAFAQHESGTGAHIVVSMSGVVAEARAADPELPHALRQWARAIGGPFPAVEPRPAGPVAELGADNEAWLAAC